MRSLPKTVEYLPLALNLLTLLAVIWIIVPAPSYYVWLFSVAASEWSLWLGLAALFGIVCALSVRTYFGGEVWILSIIIGFLSLIIALYPLFSVISIARQHDVSLSLKQYFSGIWNEDHSSNLQIKNFTTYTFAQVDGQDLQLDVYLPTAQSINNGASVIVVHGGSWSGGERSDFPQWNRWLARRGFTIFDIDYRLSQPNYLTATGDVKCAVRWVESNAEKFKIAPDRIALLGRSAGGQLALLAAYSADDARLPANCAENEDGAVRAVVSLYAPTDLIWGFDHPANQAVIDGPQTLINFLGGDPHASEEIRERFILASPVAHVNSATPPTLLIHGEKDQLVRSENLNLLAAKLKEKAVPHKELLIPYAQHGFDYNFNGWGGQLAESVIAEFLRENTSAK